MELHLVWTKSGFSRRPMSAAALAVIDSMERVPGVPFIFRSVKAPNAQISYNTVQKAFGRIVERAKIEGCTLHTIRHWFSTLTANSVSNARVGMALTGHKSHAAYMNYVHADKDQAQALIEIYPKQPASYPRSGRTLALSHWRAICLNFDRSD